MFIIDLAAGNTLVATKYKIAYKENKALNFMVIKMEIFYGRLILFLLLGFRFVPLLGVAAGRLHNKKFFTAADAFTRLESPELKPAASVTSLVNGKGNGTWSKWKYCPKYSYINSLQLQKNSNELIIGLEVECTNHLIEPIEYYTFVHGKFATRRNAPTNEGMARQSRYYNDNGLKVGCDINARAVGMQLEIGHQEQQNQGLYSINLFCLSSKQQFLIRGPLKNLKYVTESLSPQFCDHGEYICGVQVQQQKDTNNPDSQAKILTNINMRCCAGEVGESFIVPKRNSNKNAIGRILSSQLYSEFQLKSTRKFYDTEQFDEPFWYGWNFCPPNTYVVGLQLATIHHRVRLLCASTNNIKSYKAIDENLIEDEIYTKKTICDGFGVGFQVELIPIEGIITNLRMFCSGVIPVGTNQDQKLVQTYIDQEGFPNNNNGTKYVGRPHLCRANEALCGMKLIRPNLHSTSIQLHDIKMKCCRVPDRTELCKPSDELQLIVECDATEALSQTTCTYKKHIGLSITKTLTKNEKFERDLKVGLTLDRSVTDGASSTISESQSKGITNTQSGSTSITNTGTNSSSQQISHSDTTSIGSSSSATDSNSMSESSSTGTQSSNSQSKGNSHTTGSEKTDGKINIDSVNYRQGSLLSNTIGNAISLTKSQSESRSQSNVKDVSRSELTGQSNTNSQSNSIGQIDRTSHSNSQASSDTNSESSSKTHGWNFEAGIKLSKEATVFGMAKVSVEASFRAGGHGSYSSGSEKSQTSSKQQATENGRDSSSSKANEDSNTRNTQTTANTGSSSSQSNTNERQNGQTHSGTSDSSRSLNNELSKDKSIHSTISEGVQESSQTNTQHTSETGSSSSTNKGLETTNSKVTGQSTDNSQQKSLSQNIDYSKVTSETETKETGKQIDSRLTYESSYSKNTQIGSTAGQSKLTGFTTGYDWSSATSDVFTREETLDVTLNVPAGMITRLYQVVGYCSYYTVRATLFKRVDIGKDLEEVIENLEVDLNELETRSQICEAKLQTCGGISAQQAGNNRENNNSCWFW